MPPSGTGSNIRWQQLISLIIYVIYIVWLHKEDCEILWICWAVGPCSPEKSFQLSNAYTTQTTGNFKLGMPPQIEQE